MLTDAKVHDSGVGRADEVNAVTALICVAALIVLWALIFRWHPSADPQIYMAIWAEVTADFLPAQRDYVIPEPAERLAYLATLALLVPLVLLASFWVRRWAQSGNWLSRRVSWVAGSAIVMLWLLCFLALKTDGRDFWFYVEPMKRLEARQNVFALFVDNALLIAAVICTLLITQYQRLSRLFQFALTLGIGVVSLTLVLSGFGQSIFTLASFAIPLDSLTATYYAVVQVESGATLLVDLPNQYGLYPHFLEPVFRWLGADLFHYSVVMAGLVVLTHLLFLAFVLIVFRSRAIAWLTFLAVIMFGYMLLRIHEWDPYFQYYPVRTLFPASMLVLAAIYLRSRRVWLYWATCLLLGFGVLWNLESGLFALSAWFCMLCADEFLSANVRVAVRRSCWHAASMVISVAIAVSAYTFFVWLRAGELPDWGLFTRFQRTFYGAGFFMLPMPVFGFWNLMALLYLVVLIWAASSWQARNDQAVLRPALLLTALGIVTFSYYQGRSHDAVGMYVSYPAILLAGLCADHLLPIALDRATTRWLARAGLVTLLTVLVGLAVTVKQLGLIFVDRAIMTVRHLHVAVLDPAIESDIRFVRAFAKPHERVAFSIEKSQESLFYGATLTRSAWRGIPGSTEMLLVADERRMIDWYASNTEFKVFADVKKGHPALLPILKDRYVAAAQNPDTGLLLLVPKLR